ncbi:MAG: hybrid sensor histidine kinase/response regulator [bacterium]
MSRILIVDDDEGIRENIEYRLKANKFDVITASNGREAVDSAVQQHPDLVILDVMMPEMDGFTACKEIKAKTAPVFIPIIMLTALNHVTEKVKGLKSGADDFLSKPFEHQELIARVDAFLRIKALHDKLDSSYQELKKLEALKDNLTELIVHDLKTPVSAIMASLGLMKDKADNIDLDKLKNHLPKIKKNCLIQLDLISDILEINRLENNKIQLEKRKINLHQMLEDCFVQVETFAKQKDIKLTHVIADDIPSFSGDAYYIHRVMVNLVNNSLKYTERGGKVDIKISYNEKNKEFIFCIQDSGLGITPENIAKIFDRFYQVDSHAHNSRRGVGLGLAFCRIAVEAHGGKIWAESEEGIGSRFYFSIPDAS